MRSSSGSGIELQRGLLRISALLLLFGSAAAADPPPGLMPDTFLGRVEALALLETLNAELLSHDSATLTLEHWCDEHALASPARLNAARLPVPAKAASPEQRRELQVTESEPLGYRRVRLSCGAIVLSEADNWYVPSRLTPEMNQRLDTTDTPFGKVVLALNFRRHTLAADLLWHPLPQGWEMGRRSAAGRNGPLTIPAEVLQHRALLTLPDGTPISEVVETYLRSNLLFGRQSSPN